ncbi:MAG: response regulator transcription factor [Sandaracinus sp.]
MSRVRVLLVDDQALFREGLRAVLAREEAVEVVGEAANGREALALCERLKPEVVLMDLRMPELDGVGATRRITAQYPRIRTVILTTFDDDEAIFEGLRAGAVGYLLKDASGARLVEAIGAAARGEAFLQPSIATKVIAELSRLRERPPASESIVTAREHEVLRLLGRGVANKEIAAALFVTEGTVKNHLTSIFEKLGVASRTEAVVRARELGLI